MFVIALRSLHHSGWVHRDLNLSSILLDDDLTVRLAHLESAKRIDSTSPAHPGRIVRPPLISVVQDLTCIGHTGNERLRSCGSLGGSIPLLSNAHRTCSQAGLPDSGRNQFL